MTTINSVLGPVDTADLGYTLTHEHILASAPGVLQNYPELFGTGYMDRIVETLIQAKAGGVDSVVDTTTFDLGRDVTALAEASRRSGVNIIAVSGWYLELPHLMVGVSADRLAQLFVREIREGIAGTDIKAGLLKSASDVLGVTPDQETVLRGVARARLETGVPIMLHSYPARQVGRQQLAILKQEGVDLRRVKVDDSAETCDMEYLTWLLDQGCYLGMTKYPGGYAVFPTSPPVRIKLLQGLIDAGYEDRLLPSHDWVLEWVIGAAHLISHEERETRNPDKLLYIKKVVSPQLREMGVSEAVLRKLFVDNPRKFFEAA